jgi:hypothetical protein
MNIRAWEIDPATGLFVGDLPAHPAAEVGAAWPHIVTVPCPPGFIHPRWDGGQWIEGGTPDPAAALATIRQERDRLLAACDWTQLPDSPLADAARADWAAYRQALRALPDTVDPLAPVWPAAPH